MRVCKTTAAGQEMRMEKASGFSQTQFQKYQTLFEEDDNTENGSAPVYPSEGLHGALSLGYLLRKGFTDWVASEITYSSWDGKSSTPHCLARGCVPTTSLCCWRLSCCVEMCSWSLEPPLQAVIGKASQEVPFCGKYTRL